MKLNYIGSKEKKPYLLENETIKNGIEKIDAYTEHFDNWDDEIDEETWQYKVEPEDLNSKEKKVLHWDSSDISNKIKNLCSNYSVQMILSL